MNKTIQLYDIVTNTLNRWRIDDEDFTNKIFVLVVLYAKDNDKEDAVIFQRLYELQMELNTKLEDPYDAVKVSLQLINELKKVGK